MTFLKICLLFVAIVCVVTAVADEFTDEEIEPVRVKRQWGWGPGFHGWGHGWGRPWGFGGFYGGWGYPYGYGGFWG